MVVIVFAGSASVLTLGTSYTNGSVVLSLRDVPLRIVVNCLCCFWLICVDDVVAVVDDVAVVLGLGVLIYLFLFTFLFAYLRSKLSARWFNAIIVRYSYFLS